MCPATGRPDLLKDAAELSTELFKRRPVYAVAISRPLHSASNKARLLELLQVLRYRALRKWKRFDDFTADTFVALSELLKDRYSCRMTYRLSESGKILLLSRERFFFAECHFSYRIS